MKISIAITTHNRYEVFSDTYKNIKKHLPNGAKLIVVDDGSDNPVKEADFRFDNAQGIATAKNKCLELMGDADYYFLFDDDVYPRVDYWHLEYIKTGLNHLCFSFDKFSNGTSNGRKKTGQTGNIINWHEPCGLMLFLTKKCIEIVGGMDPAYGKWGYEHVGYSMRIHNAGLTPSPFMDVANSLDLFYSYDWDQTSKRSVPGPDRAKCIAPNERKYKSEKGASHFIPYKPLERIVISTYFTGVVDPQRNAHYVTDLDVLQPLIKSCVKNKCPIVVLNDCFKNTVSFVKTKAQINPYFQRWFAIHDYLLEHPEIEQVFCVDATDVEMLKNPFMEMHKGFLYVGDEIGNTVNNLWLKKHHTHPIFNETYRQFYHAPLLNAGIVGGFRDEVLDFCDKMMQMYAATEGKCQMTDMAALQHICYSWIGYEKIKHGPKINTRFKANERNNYSYFKHK
ncbi:glycosyltransferase family 2 protein [Pedobacter africanus]|uniref:Glycosyl transferase family 2 n=1 Tax=Pedobacter africanus TaxID=151894 RepID=A0A1W1ZC83_9SPHI|nr:glycosyltransferase [Pedobacter africanus]SMC45811.1 Glycosyl transferase family 2 [Pedobacter africanus]